MFKIIDFQESLTKYYSRKFYTQRFTIYNDETRENRNILRLFSYYTIIGFHDLKADIVYTWKYGNHSTTTSKQITQYCRETCSIRHDINEMAIDDFINNYIKD